jgi:hypothetical protein
MKNTFAKQYKDTDRVHSGLWFKIRKIGRTLRVKKSGILVKIRTIDRL